MLYVKYFNNKTLSTRRENRSNFFGKIYAPFSIDLSQAWVDGMSNVSMCFFTCHGCVILVMYTKKVDKLNVSFKMKQF